MNKTTLYRRKLSRRRSLIEQLESRNLLAGPHSPAAEEIGSTAISRDDDAITGWATTVVDYSPGTDVDAEFQTPDRALGPAQGVISQAVSLGRGGQITLGFDHPIRDGLGDDFAVFENAFSDTFLELGYVEVSSDGVNFFRFDSDSRTDAAVDAFGQVDPTNVHNLAGKYRLGFGTPFDLEELVGRSALLDTTRVTHVRLIDVVGDGSATDSSGNVIYDPFPTSGSAGLDVDGVGVIHQSLLQRDVIGFEDVGSTLPAQSGFSGPDPNGQTATGQFGDVVVNGRFQSERLGFNNSFSNDFGSWSGWAYSNATDTTTVGFTNQFSSFAGGGASDSATFGIAFPDQGQFFDPPTISREEGDTRRFDSLKVTNTTYAALSMLNGDAFAKKFGGASGNDPDFLLLTIGGLDDSGASIGTVDVYLADYRFADNTLDYVLDEWVEVDLSSIALAESLIFSITSSDVGPFGVNTPAYAAVDDITMVTPILSFDVAEYSVSESDGSAATTARISRADQDTSREIAVSLSSNLGEHATVASSVTIPVGRRYVEFPIGVIDDQQVNDTRLLTIEASADGFVSTSRSIEITNDDAPQLTASIESDSVVEGGLIEVMVMRNDSDLSDALPLSVSLSSTEFLSVEEPLSIPAQQSTMSFFVTATDDSVDNLDRQVSVTVSAVGFEGVELPFTVTDNDSPRVLLESNSTQLSEHQAYLLTDLEDVGQRLGDESFYNGSDLAGQFVSDELVFNNSFNSDFGSWSGWSYSNTTDVTTAGFTNQYSAFPGAGAGQSETYAVASTFDTPVITRHPQSGEFESIEITNTTYAALSILNGDQFAKKFGGESGDDPDFFLLTIDGIQSGQSIGTVEFYLADYRFENNELDYIVDEWTSVDLSPIANATSLRFTLLSSDVGQFGMNTPAYFAADNVQRVSPTLTVSRNADDLSESLQVSLASDDAESLVVDSPVIIPAGESSVTVPLYIQDDDLADGLQLVTITASAENHEVSQLGVGIEDSDRPMLTLTTPDYDLMEGSQNGRLRIHRNTADLSDSLEVNLSSGSGRLDLPSSVTIPSDSAFVIVDVVVLENDEIEADQVVSVGAFAEGFDSSALNLLIRNNDFLPPELSLNIIDELLNESDASESVSFEDVGRELLSGSFDNGEFRLERFQSNEMSFNNSYDPTFGSWSGWAISNMTDNATPGFGNQYSAFAPLMDRGSGYLGSPTYAVANAFPGGIPPLARLESSETDRAFESLMVTNTTYAALSMMQGDSFAKKFGGETGDDEDFFLLKVRGIDGAGRTVGVIEHYLADFRFQDNTLDYIVDDWQKVDLTGLVGATSLQFELESSDVGEFGMNTPAYFAVDEITFQSTPDLGLATVSRSGDDLSRSLVVDLSSDDNTEAQVPETVVIPAGSESISFYVRAQDDAVLDGRSQVVITASAPTYVSSSDDVYVDDDESPHIEMSINRHSVQESGGENAAPLILHRNIGNLDVETVVTFEHVDGLLLPENVAIPAGSVAIEVPVGVVDDDFAHGDKVLTIVGSSQGFDVSSPTLWIRDDDVAALDWQTAADSLSVERGW